MVERAVKFGGRRRKLFPFNCSDSESMMMDDEWLGASFVVFRWLDSNTDKSPFSM
jgi:hypothetical protein